MNMKDIVSFKNGNITVSSKDIADNSGKIHRDVFQDFVFTVTFGKATNFNHLIFGLTF